MANPNLYETIQSWTMWTLRWITKHGEEIGVHIDPGREKLLIPYGDIELKGPGDYEVNLTSDLRIRILIDPETRMGGRPTSIILFDRYQPHGSREAIRKTWLNSELDELKPRHHEEL